MKENKPFIFITTIISILFFMYSNVYCQDIYRENYPSIKTQYDNYKIDDYNSNKYVFEESYNCKINCNVIYNQEPRLYEKKIILGKNGPIQSDLRPTTPLNDWHLSIYRGKWI